jgi:hypothetical protein
MPVSRAARRNKYEAPAPGDLPAPPRGYENVPPPLASGAPAGAQAAKYAVPGPDAVFAGPYEAANPGEAGTGPGNWGAPAGNPAWH